MRREDGRAIRRESSTSARSPPRQRRWSSSSAARIAAGSSGDATTPAFGLTDQLGGGAVRRNGCQDRPADRDVLEHLAGEDALAAPPCLGDEQQKRLRVALQREGLGARRVRQELQPVAESEAFRPLAVGVAEVAEEARDGVEARVGERLQERPRVTPAEEASRCV